MYAQRSKPLAASKPKGGDGFKPTLAFRQEEHFIQRARERFGLTVTPTQYRYWIRKVEEVLPGTEYLHAGDAPGRTVWRIRAGSRTLHVVYDEKTGRLVTCFPAPIAHTMPRKRLLKLRARAKFVDADRIHKKRRLARG